MPTGSLAQLVLDQFQAQVNDLEQNRPITMHYSRSEWSSFHSTTRIADFWQARDLVAIQALLGDNMPVLSSILALGLLLLFQKAEARVTFLTRQDRAQLKTFNQLDPTIKEFRIVQQAATQYRYIGVLVKFFQFLLASYQYQDAEPLSPNLMHLYALTNSQINILGQINPLLQEIASE
jgi:hypothetical protein